MLHNQGFEAFLFRLGLRELNRELQDQKMEHRRRLLVANENGARPVHDHFSD